jgi:methane/ammonia monooxygenase subunit A
MANIALPAPRITDASGHYDLSILDNPRARSYYRRFDGILIIVLFSFLALGISIHYALTAGDWDYWIDWRDRRWWPLVTPLSLMMFIGGFVYPIWKAFRLPVIATAVTTLLCLVSWVSRYFNFGQFTDFPLSFTFPSTYIGLGVIFDSVLIMTRSLLISAIVGPFLFGALIWPLNWPLFAASKVPVEYSGTLVSVADLMGYQYIRTTTPEYLRIIEESTLRTFGGSVTPLTAVFSAFVAVIGYSLFLLLGAALYNFAGRYARRII